MAEHNSTPGYPFAGSFFLATHILPTRVPAVMSAIGLTSQAFSPPLLPVEQYYSSIVLQPDGRSETFCMQGDTLLTRDATDHERAQLMFYYHDLAALVQRVGQILGME